MKKPVNRSKTVMVLAAVMCLFLLAGCGSAKLSEDFDEVEVKSEAENIILLINSQDSASLEEISTVQMKEALTEDVWKQIFEAIAEGGTYEQVSDMSVAGAVDKSSGEEYAVVVVKAKYELKTFTYTISFTKQMKLAGLYYK